MDDRARPADVIAFVPKGGPRMAHPTIGQVTRYWDGLRHGRLVPTREEIDPREIQEALPYSFILDRPRPGTVRFRLSGMHLNHVLGMEARGMPVRAICEVDYRKRLMEQVEAVFEDPALVEIELRADRGVFGALRATMALLPLRSGPGRIDRALGVFITDGEVLDAPTRFMTRGFARTPLEAGVSVLDTTRRALHPAGLAEAAAPYDPPRQAPVPAPVPRGTQPVFRVLDGGKA
ncbi:PAS domain-containing protein [Rhodobacterales bacterium HKCCE2091]|nr:PAS domain-containing protein [Rhodobacterales bacterium HKCCE2091]